MKQLNISFEDEDFQALESLKGGRTWREWLLGLIPDRSSRGINLTFNDKEVIDWSNLADLINKNNHD